MTQPVSRHKSNVKNPAKGVSGFAPMVAVRGDGVLPPPEVARAGGRQEDVLFLSPPLFLF
jgi:hypothetical protein